MQAVYGAETGVELHTQQQQSALLSGPACGHPAAIFPQGLALSHQVILGWGAGPLSSAVTWHLQSPPLRCCLIKAWLDQQLLVGSPGPSGEELRHPAAVSP